MAPNIAPDVLSTLILACIYRRDGVSLDDIVAAFPVPPERSEAQRWVDELVATEFIVADATTSPVRYYTTESALAYARGISKPQAASATGALHDASASADVDAGKGAAVAGAEESSSPETQEFEAVLGDALVQIIVGLFPRASALAFLQNVAGLRFAGSDARGAFVQYGLDRLEHLTLGECLRRGIEPQQYELWRRQYFAAAGTASAPAPARDAATLAVGATGAPPTHPETPGANRDSGSAVSAPEPAGSSARSTGHSAGWASAAPADQDPAARLLRTVVDDVFPPPAIPASFGNPSPTGGAPAWVRTLGTLVVEWVRPILPRWLSPGLQLLLVGVLGLLVVLLYQALAASLWTRIGVLAAVAVGVLALGWFRQRRIAPRQGGASAAGSPGASAERAAASARAALPASSAESPNASAEKGESAPVASASGRRRRAAAWLAAAVVVGLLAIAATWYVRSIQRPSASEVGGWLATNLAPIPVRIAELDLMFGPSGPAGCRVTYAARIETTAPLYRRLDTFEYLRAHAPSELATIEAADALLRGPDGARLRAALGDGTDAAAVNLQGVVLLSTQTPAATAVGCSGDVTALRSGSGWAFSGDVRIDRSRLAGETRPAGAGVFATDAPAEAAALRALLTDRAATAARVQAKAAGLTAAADRDRQAKMAAFAEWLRPGTQFTGVVAEPEQGDSHRVAIEITDSTGETQRIGALLRNDGGWSEARALAGDWTLEPAQDVAVITLRTRTEDRVDGAGPLLEDRAGWTIVVRMRRDGTITTIPANWQLRRVDPADAAGVKTEFSRALAPSLAATRSGVVYLGTATSRLRKTAEPLILRFTEQDADGALLRATLESATNPGWVRPFRGTLVGNSYRAGGSPIRLRSDDNDRVGAADPRTLLGLNTSNNSLTVALHPEGDRLIGADGRFEYAFAPATASVGGAGKSEGGKEREGESEGGSGRSTGAERGGMGSESGGEKGEGESGGSQRGGGAGTMAEGKGAAGAPDRGRQGVVALPPLPTGRGGYVLTDGRWAALPRNNGHVVQSIPQALNAKLLDAKRLEDALAGLTPEPAKVPIAMLVFDGGDNVPAIRPENVVLVYIGAAAPTAAQMTRFPELKTYPVIELAALKTGTNGTRSASLYPVTPGIVGFGPGRISATLEQPRADVAIVRISANLASGRYALWGGPEPCELAVR